MGSPGRRPECCPRRALSGAPVVPKRSSPSQRARLRRLARIEQGLCARCGEHPPEPGVTLCGPCREKRRAVDRAHRARARGKPYGGRDPDKRRRADRARDRCRRQKRQEAGLCTQCGREPAAEGGSVCEPCREERRARERARYAARKAERVCVRCAGPTIGGSSRCSRCATLEAERVSPERKGAADRKRYARRRAQGRCTDCGVQAHGAARCDACAYRSNTRAPARHAVSVGPPYYTVIELATLEDHGTYDTEAEVAACLAFAGLRIDQVEILSNMPLMGLAPP